MVEVADGARGSGGRCTMEADDDQRDQIDRERNEREGEGGATRRGIARGKSRWLGKLRSQGVERQTQNKCRTKKCSRFVLFSGRRFDLYSIVMTIVLYG